VTLIFSIAACLAATGWSSSATAQEPLGYWALEETDIDAEVSDSSGNGNNGTFEGGVDPDVEGAPEFGSGAFFDGIDGEILIGPGDENGFGDLTSDFSVMAWIKPDQFDSKNRIFGSAPWEANAGWGWGTNSDQLEITTWGVRDYDQPVPLELDEWAHVAIVLDDQFAAHFYHNGEYIGTQSHGAGGGTTFNDFYIGYAAVEAEHFSGSLDEVALFSGALSEEQINNAMNDGVLAFDGAVPNALQAGDADQNYEFNQLDLVKVQVAAKYLTGQSATWGEGDWDGAPGGTQGSPPPGNGFFDQLDIIAALSHGLYLAGPYAALSGPEGSGDGNATIVYDANTGEVAVDVPGTELTSILIDSVSGIFTGDPNALLAGSFDSDTDQSIFRGTLGGSFGSFSFGNVAQPGLSEAFIINDLTAAGTLEGGGDLGEVDLRYIPEPCSVVLLSLGLAATLRLRRRQRT
jgi:hypothetical protein